ncbi:Bcr/CflA family drug resistance efflux transporter [Corynebacterium diphtheriae]|uniref:multidrug effflux MFS transporter n=1 Tax=Corynebacterium diphtheriae TaxID=1717 RepID=UPI00086F47F9|nr:multidrug effflux MFS transporter [Corynebacterium diphtheriae]MBG9336566.1 multidrug effflux MFS transporter [Corynebacterium diphtheriae bv. gravis]ODS16816.1 Bcr/CflA family drug resistance efflux transporter [Corynebacterium diphtheriae]ONF66650.1 Bcr/CflA family drug resistance efflux transporter [Corynebacterium diphtheriae]RLP13306.1 Bcr/CflA family efflux MFS transporter [Corynebacterium diphtheriae]CAB0932582.1 Bcr/CflA family drug resistance efflux transporter [Corynebacterium dip
MSPSSASPTRQLIPPALLGTLALVNATEPLSINMYLSGLPELRHEFGISQFDAQLTITFFLIGMTVGQLFSGPITDARGRRGLFFIGTIVLTIATLLSALAPHAWVLYLSRAAMGWAAGTAVVSARAIAADKVSGPELAKVFSILMVLGSIAPVVGPILGGLIVHSAGWRAVFWFLTVVYAFTAVIAARTIPETLPVERRTHGGIRAMLAAIRTLLSNRVYVGSTVAFVFAFATMFTFVSASPFILQEHFGFSPLHYALIFAMNTSGLATMAIINARVVHRFGAPRLAATGVTIMALAVAWLAIAATFSLGTVAFLAGIFTMTASMGMIFANTSALAMSHAGPVGGAASAFLGSGQFFIAGLYAPMFGVVQSWGIAPPLAAATMMSVTAVITVVGLAQALRSS